MNQRDMRLMNAPSWETILCPFCGRRFQSRHHIVYRSRGGHNGPTITVCGTDNSSGCHGLLHQHKLHLDYISGCWQFLRTEFAMKDEQADELKGWHPLVNFDTLMRL